MLHKIKRGETLWGIAQQYGTTVYALVTTNNIRDKDKIQAGAWLIIPPPDTTHISVGDIIKRILGIKPRS